MPLKPRLRLHSVREATGSILKRNSADQAPKAGRPVCVGCEEAKCGPAEELSVWRDLRCNREFTEPAVELAIIAARMIEAGLECEREVLTKEDLRPGAQRYPTVPTQSLITVLRLLVDNDWHDGE